SPAQRPEAVRLATEDAAGRRTSARSRRDDVLLDGIDLQALLLQPRHAPLQVVRAPLDLEGDPAVGRRHVGPADVRHEVEVLAEQIDDRVLDLLGRERQVDPHLGHSTPSFYRPPAMAGTMETSSPSFRPVPFPARNRMSSSLT